MPATPSPATPSPAVPPVAADPAAAVVPTGRGRRTLLLGIETSCDETAAAVVARHDDGSFEVLSSVVSSQIDLHARFGGVVPEVASRAHLERLDPVVAEALAVAGIRGRDLDAVAATAGPGLVGALLVGVSAAKALARVWDVPFVAVNHLEAHLFAPLLQEPDVAFPLLVLLVSGGHTLLLGMDAPGAYRVLGRTVDDAAGEAFDKVARYLGLGYPGGPAVDRLATSGDATAIAFPRSMLHDGLALSFSGLKTSVVNHVRRNPDVATADVAASFQEAVVDVLVHKARRAAAGIGAVGMSLAGGVAANRRLRARWVEAAAAGGLRAHLPSPAYCTDNAAMVAAAGLWRLAEHGPSALGCGVDPNLSLADD